MNFNGKHILLTGGSDGIGLALARQLRDKGAHVTISGRNEERLATAKAEGLGVISGDLSTPQGCTALADTWGEAPLDILINNAGVSSAPNAGVSCVYKAGEPVDLAAMDRAIFLNFHAPVHLITHFLPRLQAAREAMIVNVTSGLAIAPRSEAPIYCATKAGLRSFTMALRHQLKNTHIRMLEVLPPVVETKMTAGHIARGHRAISPDQCAAEVVRAMERGAKEANVGMVKTLRRTYSISPALARRVMIGF
ncbi:MAG: SDR family NAD(P)-dependent oxidoreductase [Alphaproteobacteria bacterium]|nr:SDR family NAD(P)-dependent oxidoreductase [Alphaproteobacteria bacterium]MDE2041850.1 SDR family NAD(P)-dependent oxidoreductase [Alphaproteobacteria bacterium]MDE2339590.1 SDR family NAD(P)-dependent oxidoreductase [Alphaproteobacteria bacterium]